MERDKITVQLLCVLFHSRTVYKYVVSKRLVWKVFEHPCAVKPINFVVSFWQTFHDMTCCQAPVNILYLRWAINLLPFLFPFLCSFFFGWSSLSTQTEDQEEDSELLRTHSGAVWPCGGEKTNTIWINGGSSSFMAGNLIHRGYYIFSSTNRSVSFHTWQAQVVSFTLAVEWRSTYVIPWTVWHQSSFLSWTMHLRFRSSHTHSEWLRCKWIKMTRFKPEGQIET